MSNTSENVSTPEQQIAALQTEVAALQKSIRDLDAKYQVQTQYIIAVVSNALGITFPPLHTLYNAPTARELGAGVPLNPTGSEFL